MDPPDEERTPPRGTPRVRLSRTLPRVGTLLVLLAVAALVAVTPARAASSDYGPYSWSNGTVLCVFNDTQPSVTVSATDLNGTGMSAGLDQIAELSPSGTPVTNAVISSVTWNPVDDSTATAFVMNYSDSVPVTSPGTPSHVVGAVQVTVNFTLHRNPTGASQADQVSFQLSIHGWPWQNTQDTLATIVPIWSAFTRRSTSSSGRSRVPVSRASGRPTANRSSPPRPVPPRTRRGFLGRGLSPDNELPPPSRPRPSLSGRGSGGLSSLPTRPHWGLTRAPGCSAFRCMITPPSRAERGWSPSSWAMGTRRLRRHPSDLTYVEEPE